MGGRAVSAQKRHRTWHGRQESTSPSEQWLCHTWTDSSIAHRSAPSFYPRTVTAHDTIAHSLTTYTPFDHYHKVTITRKATIHFKAYPSPTTSSLWWLTITSTLGHCRHTPGKLCTIPIETAQTQGHHYAGRTETQRQDHTLRAN